MVDPFTFFKPLVVTENSVQAHRGTNRQERTWESWLEQRVLVG